MFETATLSSGPRSKRVWSTCAGLAGEVVFLGCAVLVPILSPQVLPKAMWAIMLEPPGVPPAPRAPGPQVQPTKFHAAARTGFVAPSVIPAGVPKIVDAPGPPPEIGVPGLPGVPGGDIGTGNSGSGVISSLISDVHPPVLPAPPREVVATPKTATPAVAIQRIKVSAVQMAQPIFRPEPPYPPLARQMHVSGVVELEGVIGTDGHMKELRIVSGHPLLARAALEAVSKWIYRPTMLNGDPVEVIAPITVTFRLN